MNRFWLCSMLLLFACDQSRTRTKAPQRSHSRSDASTSSTADATMMSSRDVGLESDAGLIDGGGVQPPVDGGGAQGEDATVVMGVDLAITILTAPPSSARPGTVYDLILQVENLGQSLSTETNIEVTVSDGQGGPESNLGIAQVLPMMPLEQRNFQFTLTAPATPGSYLIKAYVDRNDNINDSNRANNETPAHQMRVSSITINQPVLDFGNVVIGCDSTARPLTLRNQAANPATVTGFQTNPIASDFNFADASPMTMVPPTGSLDLDFMFRPSSLGSARAVGTLDLSQSGQNFSLDFEFLGTGVSSMMHSETFMQGSAASADFMFVIDNSCSMGQEQNSLATQFPTFIQNAQTQGLDYHIAVTTTDVSNTGEQGRFITGMSGSTVLTSQTPNVETVFSAMVRMGTGGSPNEQGLEAARLALTLPNILISNAGFLRPGTTLVIIFVSDEEDHSPQTVSDYLSAYQTGSIGGGPSTVLVNAIVGDQMPGCTGVNGSADYGDRFIQLANSSGGVVDSICTNNWMNALTNFGGSLGVSSRFTLQMPANPNSIVVMVNGQVVSSTNYSYSQSVVTFQMGAEPPAGATVQIQYAPEC